MLVNISSYVFLMYMTHIQNNNLSRSSTILCICQLNDSILYPLKFTGSSLEYIKTDTMKLDDLKKGDTIPGDCGNPMNVKPEWMDTEKFQRGREFFKEHMAGIVLAMHCSLAVGLSVSNLLVALVFTGMSNTPKKAFSRYLHTFLYVVLWHFDDVWKTDSKAHKSVKKVRDWHKSIAAKMNKPSDEIEERNRKLHFSQYDMALVQSGFFAAAIMYPKRFGIRCSKKQLNDYVFFWRGIGYLLGVSDKFNLCNGTYSDVHSLCKEIEQKVLIPSLMDPPKDFEKMSDAYIEGSNIPAHFNLMTKAALFAFVFDCMGIKPPKLSALDFMRYCFIKCFVFLMYWCPFFELLCNYLLTKFYHSAEHLINNSVE